ncbi:cytochrome c-type biogenesis CcmH-like mitochondrial protein [Artemisia annua]|uniref:Cytochrome c-type biogenesis CcmH-like mitochondrial protein n=1 Tax=Artemisia annua TaxID=35608 RepID=A0A2U1M6A0_ARTAN|nr:cytochrome c-type biogenesis CcmH-like mitochondrial protein [Artemisia annua]
MENEEAPVKNISHNVRLLECGGQSIEEYQADIAVLLRKISLILQGCSVVGRLKKEFEERSVSYGFKAVSIIPLKDGVGPKFAQSAQLINRCKINSSS